MKHVGVARERQKSQIPFTDYLPQRTAPRVIRTQLWSVSEKMLRHITNSLAQQLDRSDFKSEFNTSCSSVSPVSRRKRFQFKHLQFEQETTPPGRGRKNDYEL